MDFLNQAISQIRELILSMTPAARVTALLLLGVIGVSLGYLVQHQSANPDEPLFGGEMLSAGDITRIEAALGQAKLNGFETTGNRILVPNGQKAIYLAAIADGGALPPNFHTLLENALDLGPFADRVTREQRLKAAREHQLSMLVSAMGGIETASVIYDIQEPHGLSRVTNATATVSVQPTPGETLDARQEKRIRQTVAGGIAGLTADNVTVTDLSDNSIYGGGGADLGADSFDDPYFHTRLKYEENLKTRIEKLLYKYPGAVVDVSAELDNRLEHNIQSTLPEGDAAAIRESIDDDTTTIIKEDNEGRVGLTAQGPNRNPEETTTPLIKNETTSNERQADNFVGTKTEKERLAGMVPKTVQAAIGIPRSYLISVWRERERRNGNPFEDLPDDIETQLSSLEGGIKDQIQDLVAPLLPKKLAQDNFSDVTVTFFESLTPTPVEPPSMATKAFSWASQNFNTMMMAGVAMISLVMLRSMVKSLPPSEPTTAINAATLGLETSIAESSPDTPVVKETDESSRPKLKLKKGPRLTDDLSEIVREDPDAAAAILRSWIGNAG